MVRPTLYVAVGRSLLARATSTFAPAPKVSAATFSTVSTVADRRIGVSSSLTCRERQRRPNHNIIQTKSIMQSRSHSHENSNANDIRLRASIRELQQLINGISFTSTSSSSNSPLVPAHLTSLINDAAYHEDQSNLSNEMYESVVQEMASFVSSTIASFGKSFESEGVYNPEMLKLCKFYAHEALGNVIYILLFELNTTRSNTFFSL